MTYPAPRYHEPIMMSPDHFDGVAVEGVPGVCEKLMGIFTERSCEARFLRLAPQARMPAPARKVYFVLTATDGSPAKPIATTPRCSANEVTKPPSRPRRRPRSSFSGCPSSTRRRTTPSRRNNSAPSGRALPRHQCPRYEVQVWPAVKKTPRRFPNAALVRAERRYASALFTRSGDIGRLRK